MTGKTAENQTEVLAGKLAENPVENPENERDRKFMLLAREEAAAGSLSGDGGPFGAVIVDKAGNVLAAEHNRVLVRHDPTAHAEVMAIRAAGAKIGSHDLSGCTLYTSCEPCPMCLAAAVWANVSRVVYACTREDAAGIGFRDAAIYDYLGGKAAAPFVIEMVGRDECLDVFTEYRRREGELY